MLRLLVPGGLAAALMLAAIAAFGAEPAARPMALEQLLAEADTGNADALVLLAMLHRKGAVSGAEPAKAVAMLERAAAKGSVPAYAMLGEMYFGGAGIPADWPKSVAWLRRAAEAGHGPSQYNLALMLFVGRGTERDPVQGLKWLALAATTPDAALRAKAEAKIRPVAQAMGPTGVAEGMEAARQWTMLKK
ncbi:tetratricopeptide repeat protein [Magnetospirillum sp. UT-4]|uniref:tetratricopeptide repeat protein n=1 Tax=Magnetospirillum sp. UT-4 TaxID=2681467 RepID=UPI001385CB0E